MIGALWTGISGLASHQSALDNESHNIANVNTVGYKSSRISFADQMYQDRIGKGSKILDAEKLYVQGNLKLTGVDYDMALSGDGFFTVLSTSSSGTSENLYTRAGNFRMGDNGTLQDAAGNEVQGWAMRSIDTDKDVVSTNQNVKMFTNEYTELLTSKVISHSNYIETITAKATDYSQTAMADSDTVFSGAGGKSKSAKISDVEALVSSYSTWLQRLKDEPDGGSASSTAQISQINFKSGTDSILSNDGDQAYLYINGTKYSENYVATTATDAFKADFLGTTDSAKASFSGTTMTIDTVADNTRYQIDVDGETVFYDSGLNATMQEILDGLEAAVNLNSNITPGTITKNTVAGTIDFSTGTLSNEATYDSSLTIDYDVAASRIATYKALADRISEIPGLRAYMVDETNSTGGSDDVLESTDSYKLSTKNEDMILGMIQIESLIPGESFTITEVGEVSGSNSVAGSYQTSTLAVQGEGVGALESARDALAKAITGKQQDVYTLADLGLSSVSANNDLTYSLTIYDKEKESIIPVPNDNATVPTAVPLSLDNISSVDDFVTKFNAAAATSSPALSDYVVAKNVNGNVVIETLEENYDVEFSGSLKGPVVAPATIAGGSITAPSGSATAATITIPGAGINFATGVDYTFNYEDDSGATGSITLTAPQSVADVVSQINAAGITGITATESGGNIVLTTQNTDGSGDYEEWTSASLVTAGTTGLPLDKNNDYSGRQGAGAEFIELVNTIDQTTTQSSLQLKLDTLGISDSAFGAFSVDSSGVIYMTQDGADFAIGQVSIALFNNNRGLEPSGDNLLAKTNDSGEPIYNLNNDKTAKIEGKTLELSTADLSESLVNLMVFQRAFEANAKSITTSDELLNTLINLKR